MTSRGKGGRSCDWDPMRDDFNDTSYNSQNPYDDDSEVQLDHTNLYVTKIPPALSPDGFVELFSKYGRLVHTHFSRDPQKRYAFAAFETAGEARIAMMKLNRTEPFGMNVCFAHNKNKQSNADRSNSNTDRQISRKHSKTDKQHSSIDRHNNDKSRDDSSSVSSRGRPRNIEDQVNGDDGDETEDEVGADPKLEYDLEKIKLQRLQIMDQQLLVQQRMLIQQQRMKNTQPPVTKRRLLPDGRSIQVSQDNETSLTAGAGDSAQRNIPGLQRQASRRCVACGAPAELYCAGCRVTPYCAERCQRRDWDARHRALCHNLARSSTVDMEKPAINGDTDVPAEPRRLRRPHSPSKNSPREPPRTPTRDSARDSPCNESLSGRDEKREIRKTKFVPPAEKHTAFQQSQQRKQPRAVQNDNRSQEEPAQNRSQGNQDAVPPAHNQGVDRNREEQDNRPPLSRPAKLSTEPVKPAHVEPALVETKPEHVTVASLGSARDTTPRKPLVPASYVAEKIPVGATFVVAVVERATNCGSKQSGYACLTLHEDYSDAYTRLCDEFAVQCSKDNEEYTPRVGETFAFLCAEDEGWYRARCLAPSRGALLDSARAVSLTPRACRRLPPAYAAIPEFIAVLKMEKLEIGVNLRCTVVSCSASVVNVSVVEEAGTALGEAEVTRWIPEVEYPAEREAPPIRQPEVKPAEREPMKEQATETQMKPTRVEPTPQNVSSRVNVRNASPRKPLVPNSYIVEKLSVGATFVAEAICRAQECGSKQTGYACLTLHEDYSDAYNQLCIDFSLECMKDKDEYMPRVGETFAFLCAEDEGWYRARCLAQSRGALLDSARAVSLTPRACRRLPPAYAAIPEFIAVLKMEQLEIGGNLSCTVVSRSASVVNVSVMDEAGKSLGEAELTRWIPEVEYPAEPAEVGPASAATPKAAAPKAAAPSSAAVPVGIPEVPRRSVEHNCLYVLLDVTSLSRACVRPCDARSVAAFDSALQSTLLYATTAAPLQEPPVKGQTVIAKFIEDGTHYRALVKRVSVAKNKYLIEYIEYGNEEIVPLERLYPCPAKLTLDAAPAQASIVRLSDREPATLTAAAMTYIESLKDNATELILAVPGGNKTAASGSLVNLLIAKNCDSVTKRIEELCTPEWKKLLEKGGDVLETECRFFAHLNYCSVPTSRPFVLRVTFCDIQSLARGAVCGYEKGDKTADLVYGELADQIAEYCASPLCRDPYLPKAEELCITRSKRVNKWVRSVLVAQADGPGSEVASVMHIDYGDLEDVSTADIRKMLPDFVDSKYPALAQDFDIQRFPVGKVTRAQLERGLELMKVTAEGVGELHVRSCRELDDKMFELDAPDLIDALTQ